MELGRVSNLMQVGYSKEEAEYLSQHEYFKHKTKSAEELLALFQKIADVYDCDVEAVKRAVMKWPQFAGYDHERVVREATAVYGDEEGVKKAVMKFPMFAALNHERVVAEAAEVYGDEEGVKKAVMKHPQFAGLNHEREVAEAAEVYGDEEGVKKAVMKFPMFAALNHEKKICSLLLIGEIVGFDEKDLKAFLLNKPNLAGCAVKRYVAGLDVAKKLEGEGHPMDESMRDAYFKYVEQSPYVPKTKRRRISQCPAGSPDPPLLKKMRKSLRRVA